MMVNDIDVARAEFAFAVNNARRAVSEARKGIGALGRAVSILCMVAVEPTLALAYAAGPSLATLALCAL